MARDRHRKANSSTKKSHVDKLRAVSRAGIVVDPFNARSVAQHYRQLTSSKSVKYRSQQRIPKELERAAPKKTRDELKKHGFQVTKRGVIVDGPRDKNRNPIKGSRVQIMRGGVVKTTVGSRADFIYGFTRKEKKEFARDPAAFEKKKIAELRKKYPLLRHSRKLQVRLQWGAYQATKDFSPTYFTAKYFATVSPEEKRKVGKKKARPRADKLTGLHIVVHTPSKARKRRKTNAKGRKKK